MRVFKLTLRSNRESASFQRVLLPARPLSFGYQSNNGHFVIWYPEIEGETLSEYFVGVFWTGVEIEPTFEPRHFVGTVQVGPLVYHCFARLCRDKPYPRIGEGE